MSDDPGPYEEGKRAGLHPVAVVFGVILIMWVLINLAVPSGKQKQAMGPEISQVTEDLDAAPVMFKVQATLPDVNAVSVTVPSQATTSQIIGLLKRFKAARLDQTLGDLLPPTSPGHKLGDHAVGDIYIFSEGKYAQPDSVRTLSRGAHAPGDLYPQAIPFEEAMEHVLGHYRIDLNDTSNPDTGSLGFADDSGVHSRQYRRIF
ncbi:MAG TPA: hypothetical protein VFQ34_12215 [Nitrospiraceae bacterium]|jgi:hypothetical protein|nr:hypothetical protein [Nitrospiraceae bacterium]